MPTPSRFTRSGLQAHQGELILVRRGKPLPNKGRYSFTDREDRIWGEGEEEWLITIMENNPMKRTPYNPWLDLAFIKAIEANNPSS